MRAGRRCGGASRAEGVAAGGSIELPWARGGEGEESEKERKRGRARGSCEVAVLAKGSESS
eukprot:365082-Chlamydomonas_euryale.AAC.8